MSYMKDSTGRRLDGFEVADAAARSSSLAPILGRMQRGTEDAVLAFLGDSTGNEDAEWIYKTLIKLGQKFPAWSIDYNLWNALDSTDSPTAVYGSTRRIQTGTGFRVLTVYNASTPGALAAYSVTRLARQLPVAPHAVVLSYGHNSAGTTARNDVLPLTRLLQETYPAAPITLVAQNPRVSTDAGYAADLSRQQSIIDLAQGEGFGLINALQRFLASPTYAADWLNPDGLHPNPAGSDIWADEAFKHFRATASSSVPQRSTPALGRREFSALRFALKSGTPTRVDTNDVGPTWSFPTTGTSIIHGMLEDIPPGWDRVNFYALWYQITGTGFTTSNNTARIRTRVKPLGAPGYDTAPQTAASLAMTSLGDVNLAANNAATYVKKTTFLGYANLIGYGWTGGPITLELQRLGDDAADNYIDPLLLLGIAAIRQS